MKCSNCGLEGEGIKILAYLSADEKLIIELSDGRELHIPVSLSQISNEEELRMVIKEFIEVWRQVEALKNKVVII